MHHLAQRENFVQPNRRQALIVLSLHIIALILKHIIKGLLALNLPLLFLERSVILGPLRTLYKYMYIHVHIHMPIYVFCVYHDYILWLWLLQYHLIRSLVYLLTITRYSPLMDMFSKTEVLLVSLKF